MTNEDQKISQSILDFWFGAPDFATYGNSRMEWFKKDDGFDEQIRTLMLAPYERAARGEFDHWCHDTYSALALIILLDQAPRNLFRNSPQTFATDTKARDIALHVVSMGLDQVLLPVMRTFVYLPFEHSETMADQNLSVKLFKQSGPEAMLPYACQHREIIDRFGRFPHRNEVLGRTSTPEEFAFLNQPNSSF